MGMAMGMSEGIMESTDVTNERTNYSKLGSAQVPKM